MAFDQIEKIKREYTDKYVMVDGKRPELARFRDLVGQVKTVNMSGRALVEFDDYHLNIGWYDIDLDFLKVVDKPQPKPKEEKKAAAKPAAPAAKKQAPAVGGEKKLSPLEMARQQGAGAAKAKSSVADILAAARGKKPSAAKAEAAASAPPAEQPAPVEKAPAPEPVAKTPSTPPPSSSTPSKVDKSSMSVDDMVAYCREHDAG